MSQMHVVKEPITVWKSGILLRGKNKVRDRRYSYAEWRACLIELLLPTGTRCTFDPVVNPHAKCRSDRAKVVAIRTKSGRRLKGFTARGPLYFKGEPYRVGQMVFPHTFNKDERVVCGGGIHFYGDKDRCH